MGRAHTYAYARCCIRAFSRLCLFVFRVAYFAPFTRWAGWATTFWLFERRRKKAFCLLTSSSFFLLFIPSWFLIKLGLVRVLVLSSHLQNTTPPVHPTSRTAPLATSLTFSWRIAGAGEYRRDAFDTPPRQHYLASSLAWRGRFLPPPHQHFYPLTRR